MSAYTVSQWACTRCNGTGYANAARDMDMEDTPLMHRPLGVYRCDTCNGTGLLGISDELAKDIAAALAKRNAP